MYARSCSSNLGLAVLMDKGIIIGAEHEVATRLKLPFVMFRHATSVRYSLPASSFAV
jgi:hypothetical protein